MTPALRRSRRQEGLLNGEEGALLVAGAKDVAVCP